MGKSPTTAENPLLRPDRRSERFRSLSDQSTEPGDRTSRSTHRPAPSRSRTTSSIQSIEVRQRVQSSGLSHSPRRSFVSHLSVQNLVLAKKVDDLRGKLIEECQRSETLKMEVNPSLLRHSFPLRSFVQLRLKSNQIKDLQDAEEKVQQLTKNSEEQQQQMEKEKLTWENQSRDLHRLVFLPSFLRWFTLSPFSFSAERKTISTDRWKNCNASLRLCN